ncbi:MAG: exodeoxyribonuclease III [Smithellaceae bacterium]|nr:exodeoxyribonuclease III [Syntrophaceae bacterium]MDD4242484.1 exodeoxyribonuclease III [Smithellaceae bacterium]NLX53098.1 exodeoxyribonuclease III [Deltaproteobacteria bacterium]
MIYTRIPGAPQKFLSAPPARDTTNGKFGKALKNLKIASYNVNSIRSRLHIVLPWLEKNRPDVFCMQETKVEDAKFPAAEIAALGYTLSFRGNKQYNGVAIATREKPAEVFFGLADEPADPDRLAGVRLGDLVVLNAYVPQGQEVDKPQFAYKLAWLGRLRKFLEKNFRADRKLALCGDFNVAPQPIDVHDPKRILGHVSFNPEVWKAYEDLASWGLVDVFRRHHPDEPGCYTFFDYRVRDSVGRNLGWRVDHILATGVWALASAECAIDLATRTAEKPSDHAVIWARFAEKKQ